MSSLKGDHPWLVQIGATTCARADLICFPHAGAGASVFMRWRPLLPSAIGLFALQTPGREDRSIEPAPGSISDVIAALLPEMLRAGKCPYVLFGHSLGAIVAFELARAVRRTRLPNPAALIVSSAHPPHLKPRDGVISHLPDGVFLQQAARRYGGLSTEILADPALAGFIAPILRCDIGLYESYSYQPENPLDCPIVAYGGTADPRVPYHALSGWRAHTNSNFRARVFPGDHFYLLLGLPAVARAISEEVGLAVRASSELAGVP